MEVMCPVCSGRGWRHTTPSGIRSECAECGGDGVLSEDQAEAFWERRPPWRR